MSPDLSIVIAVKNGGPEFNDQLSALADQEWDGAWEVIVADNGSSDNTAAVVSRFEADIPGLRIVDASDRPGQAHALNVGAKAATGRSLLFLDSDDLVTPGYLEAMGDALVDLPFVAGRLDCDALNPPWLRKSRPPTQTDSIGAPFAFMPSAAGCSLGVWKTVFDEVEGFDSSIMAGNDVDFCWRVQLTSYRLEFVHDAVVQYRYRDTFRGIYLQARSYGAAGPRLYHKYRDSGMPRRPIRRAVRFHAAAIIRLAGARSKSDLAGCIFLLGFRVGLITGSVRNRVLYL